MSEGLGGRISGHLDENKETIVIEPGKLLEQAAHEAREAESALEAMSQEIFIDGMESNKEIDNPTTQALQERYNAALEKVRQTEDTLADAALVNECLNVKGLSNQETA